MIKTKLEVIENPSARKFLASIADEDMRSFGQMALIESRGVCPVDTGNLKRHLEAKQEANRHSHSAPKVTVLRSRTGYGGYVHFGTTKMAARPFFAWGTDAAIPKFKTMLNNRNDYRK